MDKEMFDYITGDMSLFQCIMFRIRSSMDRKLRDKISEYQKIWNYLDYWDEKCELPDIELPLENQTTIIWKFRYMKYAFLIIAGIIGLGLGLYLGNESYVSAEDYMDYAVEVLYEE